MEKMLETAAKIMVLGPFVVAIFLVGIGFCIGITRMIYDLVRE